MKKAVTFAVLMLSLAFAGADENSDLDLIPVQIEQAVSSSGPRSSDFHSGRIYLENVTTSIWNKANRKVPLPSVLLENQNRTSVDCNYQWQLLPNLQLRLSDRFTVFEENDIVFPSDGTLRNDLREGSVSWELFPGTFVEAGRVNIRSGAALGYNPTDYFKPRTLVSQASIDPSALRENRLGVFLVEGQKIWDRGSLRVAFAPAFQSVSPITHPPASLDLLLGRTNATNRFFSSFTYDWGDFSPQFLVFSDEGGFHVGVNYSHVITPSIVGYLEWSGNNGTSLSTRAIRFGKNTGALAPTTPIFPKADTGAVFQNDFAVGASYTSTSRWSLNLEYHFHQAGFSKDDFSNWVSFSNPSQQAVLWYIRQYAVDQQEPLMQQQLFLRVAYPDAFFKNLNLESLGFIDPFDGSSLWQVSVSYFLSRLWTLTAYFGSTFGGAHTEKGSLPQSMVGAGQIVFYLL